MRENWFRSGQRRFRAIVVRRLVNCRLGQRVMSLRSPSRHAFAFTTRNQAHSNASTRIHHPIKRSRASTIHRMGIRLSRIKATRARSSSIAGEPQSSGLVTPRTIIIWACSRPHMAICGLYRATLERWRCAVDSSFNDITLAAPAERIGYMTVSRDGRYLAGGSVEGTVYVWDLKTPNLLGKLVGHEGTIRTIDFSDDRNSILSCGNDGTVRVWQFASGAEVLRFGTRQRPVHSMALNPAGTMLVLGLKEGDQYGLEIHRLDAYRNHSRGPSGHGTEGQ